MRSDTLWTASTDHARVSAADSSMSADVSSVRLVIDTPGTAGCASMSRMDDAHAS